MRNVALDLATKKVVFCEVADGVVIKRHTARSVAGLSELLGPESPPAQVAIEACREAWRICAELEGWGNKVLLVDTTRVRRLGIGHHGRKTDRIDAETLARAVEERRIPLAHLLSPERQRLRAEVGVRRALVEARASYVTTIRGLFREAGVHAPSCTTDTFAKRLTECELPPELKTLIEPLRLVLETLCAQLDKVDARLEALCNQEPIVEVLRSVPGVGLVVAASYVSVIDDAKRFDNAHQVSAYVGLVPYEDSSGDVKRLGKITKQGNSYLRAMLVQAAWSLMRTREPDPLAVWAHAVAERRGQKIAIVALARRLAGVLWAMWRDGTYYDASSVGRASAKGLAAENVRRAKTKAAVVAATSPSRRRRTTRPTMPAT
jgi:transposase